MEIENLNRQNFLIVSVVQACIGALSGNVRMVAFTYTDDEINLYVKIDKDLQEDREEIADIADGIVDLTEDYKVVCHIEVVGGKHIDHSPYSPHGPIVTYKQRQDG